MLHIKDLSTSINNKRLLNKITFEAKQGELIAILGPNGAGKSTLINAISGTLPSDAVFWKNQLISKFTADEIALERAVLTQQIQMSYDFPVKEVVLMGRYPHFKNQPTKEDFTAVDKALEFTDMKEFANRSYQTLSGGEKQRVQTARVFAQIQLEDNKEANKLLLLDEPLNNLDIHHQHLILQRIKQFSEKKNVTLLVLHDLNMAAQYADKILLLKNSHQLAFGTVEEVLNEDLISDCYELKVKIDKHPYLDCPTVYFGCYGQMYQKFNPTVKGHSNLITV